MRRLRPARRVRCCLRSSSLSPACFMRPRGPGQRQPGGCCGERLRHALALTGRRPVWNCARALAEGMTPTAIPACPARPRGPWCLAPAPVPGAADPAPLLTRRWPAPRCATGKAVDNGVGKRTWSDSPASASPAWRAPSQRRIQRIGVPSRQGIKDPPSTSLPRGPQPGVPAVRRQQ